MSGRIAVFGLGNVLLHDDALGPQVIRELWSRWEFPEDVFIDDLGTPGLELSTHLAGYDTVLLADAVAGSEPSGTIRVFDRAAILAHPTGIRLGPHDPSLAETVRTMELVDDGPRDVMLFGAVPSSTKPGIGLAPELREAAVLLTSLIVDELVQRGRRPVPRTECGDSKPWWESEPGEAAWRIVGA